jgi:hypothetical protein
MPALMVILALSILLVAVLVVGLGWRRPGREDRGPAVLFLLTVLFLGMWAGSLWVEPVGPVIWGVPWVPLVVVGLILAGVLAVTVPPRRMPPGKEIRIVPDKTSPAERTLGMLFWVLLVLLVLVIAAGYLLR